MTRLFETFWQHLESLGPRLAMGLLIFVGFGIASGLFRRFMTRISYATDFNTGYVLRLGGRIGAIALIIFGAVTALGTMGINVTALVAGLGLTGFALGFALKDVLANFLAGVLILLYRPFVLKDHIKVGDLEGTVAEIDLRYTTLEGQGRKYLIPNSVLLTNSIVLIERAA
ncbi:MAG TPA: mechanosensitive ion channel domain-containing protein [Nitrospirales bacterium]|nr:mechanosensitive ion channel domain-containing protein [Nitrospirales bacterium]